MTLHGNARLTPRGRLLMCRRVRHEGWTVAEAAMAAGCSERTTYRWLARFDVDGSMQDRSSAPHSVPNRTPADVEAAIERLRRLRWTSTRIAAELDLATSTVCAVLPRIGLNRLSRLEPLEPPNRYFVDIPASSSTSTSRNSAASTSRATVSPAEGPATTTTDQDGKRSTSQSTTPPAWLTSSEPHWV